MARPPNPTLSALPNAITLARLAMALALPLAPDAWLLPLIVAAALSDMIDGLLSRALRVTSTAGQVLDPVADKAFIVGALLTLLVRRRLGPVELILVAARDLAVAGASLVALRRHGWAALTRMPPRWAGKATTALQFAYLVALAWPAPAAVLWGLLVPTALVSLVAAADYLAQRHRFEHPPATGAHDAAGDPPGAAGRDPMP